MADLQEVAAADVQIGALALVTTQVVTLGNDFPGVFNPPLAQTFVQLTRQGTVGGAVAWL
jgi:hypothetical protein